MKIKMSPGEKVFQVINYIVLTLLSFVCLYPLWHVAMASVSGPNELFALDGLLFWPKGFTTDAYRRVFGNSNILIGYKNTILLLVVGVSLQMLMTMLGAYFFSRKDIMFRRPLMLMVMFTMFFSGGMVPSYLNLMDLKLLDSLFGVVCHGLISTYNMIILRTAFESIPDSLSEAAKMDGAGHMTILFKIILPLSKATIAVLVLYYGVSMWNSWFWPALILRDRDQWPLAVFLREILITNQMQAMDTGLPAAENIKYALIMVATVPILCVYPFLQKYFAQGVMIGAVKE